MTDVISTIIIIALIVILIAANSVFLHFYRKANKNYTDLIKEYNSAIENFRKELDGCRDYKVPVPPVFSTKLNIRTICVERMYPDCVSTKEQRRLCYQDLAQELEKYNAAATAVTKAPNGELQMKLTLDILDSE